MIHVAKADPGTAADGVGNIAVKVFIAKKIKKNLQDGEKSQSKY